MRKLLNHLVRILVFGGLCFAAYMLFHDMDGPLIAMTPDTGSLSPVSDISLHLEDAPNGVRAVLVSVRKGNQSAVVFEQAFVPARPSVDVRFNLKNSGVREGQIELEIRATDGSLAGFGQGNTSVRTVAVRIDAKPPVITVLSPPGVSCRRGSAAAVAYRLSESVSMTGVSVGDEFFPAYPQQDGVYFCMLAFPIDMELNRFAPEIVARDLAGNEARSRIVLPAQERAFKTDVLTVDDRFLQRVMPAFEEILPDTPDLLERYIKANDVLRRSNEATLREIAKSTAPAPLWQGAFGRLPSSASRAGFGDKRTYMYNGKAIDQQTHMGQDMASVRNAPVPAANHGRVVFADFLGIFGNMVVIDHGIGLMSLYSHMSSIAVAVGTEVGKGDILGQTGTTGLAGGDHLHFGILVHGIQVQPLDWLDGRWLANNVTNRLARRQ
jgi:murein DD-endopeptidase MepM/ murein hydrolase activator NlpD